MGLERIIPAMGQLPQFVRQGEERKVKKSLLWEGKKKSCCAPAQPNQDLMWEKDGWDGWENKWKQGWESQGGCSTCLCSGNQVGKALLWPQHTQNVPQGWLRALPSWRKGILLGQDLSSSPEAEQGIVHPTKTGIQGMQRSFREELGLGRPQGCSLLHPRVGCAGGTP